jgi:hypothetical protein
VRLDAYYYSFNETGVPAVDKVLSAVACAGKAFHHTDSWRDDVDFPESYAEHLRGRCPMEWIQNAAIDAAKELSTPPVVEGVSVEALRAMIAKWSERSVELGRRQRSDFDSGQDHAIDAMLDELEKLVKP